MSELAVTLLRLGYLVLLWVFVLSALGVLKSDLYGTKITTRGGGVFARRAPPTPSGGAASTGPAPPSRRSSGPTRLVVTEGPLRGTTLPLTTSAILIGRAPSCTLVLDDDYSSSRHARIFPQGGQWLVEDLGSTNGTFVGSIRVEAPTPILPGAHVRVGQSVVELQR